MKYSRNQINRAGEVYISKDTDDIAKGEASVVIDNWRKQHLFPLNKIYYASLDYLKSNNLNVVISSQRLKRITSIREKLERNNDMRLGGMQDVGGFRFVFPDIDSLSKAYDFLIEKNFESFKLEKHNDYIICPKESGYRGYHFIYKYESDDEYDGLRVELQIRTKLQHDWATAVETAELLTKSQLKASMGDAGWLYFFKLVSAIFAKKEAKNVASYFAKFSDEDYCKDFARIDADSMFVEKLKGLRTIVASADTANFKNGYVVILINFSSRNVQYRCFEEKQWEQANDLYVKMEDNTPKEKGAVVLVSIADIEELRKAYPSYFLDTAEFLQSLSEFENHCKLMKYI